MDYHLKVIIEGSKVLSCAAISDLVNSVTNKNYKIELIVKNESLRIKRGQKKS